MRFNVFAAGAAALVVLTWSIATTPSAHAWNAASLEAAQTVWDGSYTEAQAARGREQYLKDCSSCHSENLQGGDEAPGLVGSGFLAQWVDLSVSELLERTRTTMPQDRPGKLSRANYADIIAFIFKVNGFPAGQTELPTDSATLKTIQITSKTDK